MHTLIYLRHTFSYYFCHPLGDIVAKINQRTGMVRFGEDDIAHDLKESSQNGQGSGTASASASASSSSGSGIHGYGMMGVHDDGTTGRRQQQHHRETTSEMLLHTLEGSLHYPFFVPFTDSLTYLLGNRISHMDMDLINTSRQKPVESLFICR